MKKMSIDGRLNSKPFFPKDNTLAVKGIFENASGTLDKRLSKTTRKKIALIGGFKPRKCGIATFTTDIFEQFKMHRPEISLRVFAMRSDAKMSVDADAYETIDDWDKTAYSQAAWKINEMAFDAVWIQHEFGIFGGQSGEYILELINRIAAPLIITMHTVLEYPDDKQRDITLHICAKASQIIVMSENSKRLLCEVYGADERLVSVVEHGAPDRPQGRQDMFKAEMGLAGKTVLTTFGLIGPGKGLENVIAALPEVVEEFPDIVYRIVGATHPNLVRDEGEKYRESLKTLAAKLGVADHIIWDNRFIETEELLDQLEACEIYLTPYPNLQQSVSGTLSYAVALGKAVISTPYVHARELLADDVGILVPPGDSDAIAQALRSLLADRSRLESMMMKAYSRGRETLWSEFINHSAAIIDLVANTNGFETNTAKILGTPGLQAVIDMTDDTGMFQHSIGAVPDRNHGYCLDDNVRALMLTCSRINVSAAERTRLSYIYASFVQHCWHEERGTFRNFMGFDRQWLEKTGSEDSNGRAIWALGYVARNATDADLRAWAKLWFERTAAIALEFGSPRAVAFAILGACAMLEKYSEHDLASDIVRSGGLMLFSLLKKVQRKEWCWFETVLGYDNARLAQALIVAGNETGNADWTQSGLAALRWLSEIQTSAQGWFRPVGSDSFGIVGETLPFDQQPLEAWAMIAAAGTAQDIAGDSYWHDYAQTVFSWFIGYNDRSQMLANTASGACRDGLAARGVNQNQGAESVLAFQHAYYCLASLQEAKTGKMPRLTEENSVRKAHPIKSA